MTPAAPETIAPPRPAPGRPLSTSECWSHLREESVGRLGYQSGRGPRHVVLPYAVQGSEVVVRVPAYNEATQYAAGAQVTFDVVTRVAEGAERVEVVGRARLAEAGVDDPQDLPDERWPADLPTRLVRLSVDRLHGEAGPLTAARSAAG